MCVLAVYLEDIFFVDACVACVNSLTAVNIYFREIGKILYEFNGVGADVERLVDGKRSTIVSKCQGVFYQTSM